VTLRAAASQDDEEDAESQRAGGVGARRSSVVIEEAKCEIISNHGGKYSLVGEMVLASDPDSMYHMLTDYAASPRIFSTVDSVETRALEDGAGTLLVSQSCRWKFIVFGGAFPCALAVKEAPADRFMEVALHSKGFIREFEGSWRVTEEPGGGVRVRHTLALRPALTPPYAHKIFLRQIGEIFADVAAEVESWQGASYPAPNKKFASLGSGDGSGSGSFGSGSDDEDERGQMGGRGGVFGGASR